MTESIILGCLSVRGTITWSGKAASQAQAKLKGKLKSKLKGKLKGKLKSTVGKRMTNTALAVSLFSSAHAWICSYAWTEPNS